MYFKKCPHCGCHLDPGEKCDCLEQKEKMLTELLAMMYLEEKSRQYSLKPEKTKSL